MSWKNLETDNFISNYQYWNIYKCDLCNHSFALQQGGKRAGFCYCSPLIHKQGQKASLIYFLTNEDALIKAGLSSEGKSFTDRLHYLNREAVKAGLKPFQLTYVDKHESRAIAFSIERMIHARFKDHTLFKKPYAFQGQGEIMVDIPIEKVFGYYQIIKNLF